VGAEEGNGGRADGGGVRVWIGENRHCRVSLQKQMDLGVPGVSVVVHPKLKKRKWGSTSRFLLSSGLRTWNRSHGVLETQTQV
jgi:hypothetical protein